VLINYPRVGPVRLHERLNERKAVVVSIDPAHENKNKFRKYVPTWTVCDDKIMPWTTREERTAAQVVGLDVPVNLRFVFHLNEPILGDLCVIDQISDTSDETQHQRKK
jgi:hypothetical protein